jgi:hypothetical protein
MNLKLCSVVQYLYIDIINVYAHSGWSLLTALMKPYVNKQINSTWRSLYSEAVSHPIRLRKT